MSNTLIRRFPKAGSEIYYSRRQLLEMNILLMQAFFPEPFTNKEIEILVQYCMVYKDGETLLSKENKAKVVEKSKLKSIATLNEYNKRLRNKHGLVFKGRQWTLNPILYIPDSAKELQLLIVVKDNALARKDL